MYTVSQYKDQLSAILSGMNLNTVPDLNGTIERAARTLVQRADIPEAQSYQNIALYDGVYDYKCDHKLFGTAIVDLRPQGQNRQAWNSTVKTFGMQFDLEKKFNRRNTQTTFEYINGQPIIRVTSPLPNQRVVIDSCTVIGDTPNEWTASGTASNLAKDSSVFYHNNSSLRFNQTTGVGTVSKTLQNSLNLSQQSGEGVVFLATYVPDVSHITQLTVRLATDGSNYAEIDATEAFTGNLTNSLWQLIAFDMSQSVTTGVVDWENITEVSVSVTSDDAVSNIHIGDLFVSMPYPVSFIFQTAAIFKPVSNNIPIQNITLDTDTIILSDPAYNIFLYEGALAILENTSGGAGDPMTERINRKLNGDGTDKNLGLYVLYRGDNPSQEIRQTESWYNNNIGGWFGYGSRT